MAPRFTLIALLLAGCAATPLSRPPAPQATACKVYYATDRAENARRAGHVPPVRRFGRIRSSPPALHVGSDRVEITPTHRLGKLDEGVRILPDGPPPPMPQRAPSLQQADIEARLFAEEAIRPALHALK